MPIVPRFHAANAWSKPSVPEPYLAVLDAFSRLLKRRHRAEVESALKRCAPTWVAQLPVLAAAAGDGLAQDTLGATPGRMLREVAEALEDLTRNLALVLAGGRRTLE